MAITRAIEGGGLTQQAAAEFMGIDQPEVSYIIRRQLSDFSVERLMGFLKGLGLDVEIVLRKTPKSRKQEWLRVRTG